MQKRKRYVIYAITALNLLLSALIVWFVAEHNSRVEEDERRRKADPQGANKSSAPPILSELLSTNSSISYLTF